jgi:integrase
MQKQRKKPLRKISRRRTISFQEAFDDFMLFKTADGLAKRTLKDYRYHITKFFAWCDENRIDAWGDYDTLSKAVRAYFVQLVDCSPGYYNIARQNIRAFFDWCVKHGILSKNPAGFLKKRRDDPKIRCVDMEDLKKFLALPDRNTYAGLRDYVIMLLMLDTGIRPGEALSLKPEDFDLRSRTITIPAENAKARRSRTLPLSPVVCHQIISLLSIRPEEWPNNAPIFASYNGTRLRVDNLCSRFAKYSRLLGKKMTPYDLRHTFALTYLRRNGNVFSLQATLGHSDMNMTK